MVVLVCAGVLGGVLGCWVHAFWDVLPHPGPQSPGNIARSRNELARASEQWRLHTIALCARADVQDSEPGGGAETRRGGGHGNGFMVEARLVRAPEFLRERLASPT